MDDPESQNLVNAPSGETREPIQIWSMKCRFQDQPLVANDLHRFFACICGIQWICGAAILYLRDPLLCGSFNLRWLPILALCSASVMYGLMYVNLKADGWGAADSRFWCDVKIMYVRGFNTVRTITRFLSSAALTMLFAALFDTLTPTNVVFACVIAIIAEWQAGLTENHNQYDVKVHDKFVTDKRTLDLEVLHEFQRQHPHTNISWSPFVVHAVLKFVLYFTFVVFQTDSVDFVFKVPVALLVWTYEFVSPAILDFMYLKGMCSFVKLEMYRMIVDTTLLGTIMAFTLV